MQSAVAQEHVYLVRIVQIGSEEVFVRKQDAMAYAASNRDAVVTKLKVRASIREADEVVERRMIVDATGVLGDSLSEVRTFCDTDLASEAIKRVDVESFPCTQGHWHILGFGTDRRAVMEATGTASRSLMRQAVPAAVPSRRDPCALVGR